MNEYNSLNILIFLPFGKTELFKLRILRFSLQPVYKMDPFGKLMNVGILTVYILNERIRTAVGFKQIQYSLESGRDPILMETFSPTNGISY